jgi:hypothetical protein
MQIDPKGLLNTKMWVPRFDAMAVQNALLKVDFLGYELALDKSKAKFKFPRNLKAVAFFIDNEGFIETIEVTQEDEDLDYREYIGEPEEEINYEVVL